MDDSTKKEERPHPRARANPISALTFWWILPTFWLGYKRDLEKEDLFDPLKEHRSEYLGDKFERYWNEELTSASLDHKTPSLLQVMIRCFGRQFMLYGLLLGFVEIVLRVSQPLFLGRLVKYFSTSDEVTLEEAYICAVAIIMCSGINIFFIHPFMMAIFHMGMKMRVACCSLIYRKSLRLSKTALGETTAGQVVNLLSNDVNRFDVAVIFLHYLWLGPLETCIVTYFMWNEVGVSAVIGVAALLLIIPLQGYLGKKTSTYRLKTAIRTDERVRLMNEIISGIQVIKMYTWEQPFAKMVSLARRNEIKMIRLTSYIRGTLLSFIMFSTRISIFITVLAYVLMGNHITAEKVFILTSFYSILRQTMTVFFPQGIAQVAEALVSVERLQNFLLYDELRVQPLSGGKTEANGGDQVNGGQYITAKQKDQMIKDDANDANRNQDDLGVVLEDVTAKWNPTSNDNTLTNINLTMKPGRLVAIIGPVGAGKTSLLHVILRELPITSGRLTVTGQVSYASQEPWMFAGSVRQNILFGQPYDSVRYREVVNVCALKRDFQLLPYGDKTIVGDRGTSLSGGQRARINLARAMYKQADVYLLDDPLSAVDTHVGKHLFDDCITGYLKSKTCVLVTHQLQYLKNVDQILIMNNGKIQAEGTYNQLQASGTDFAKLLESEEGEEDSLEDGVVSRHGSFKRVSSTGSAYSIDEKGLDPTEVSEMRTSGDVSGTVYRMYFSAGGNCCVITTMLLMCVMSQVLASGCDYWITYWTNLEEQRTKLDTFYLSNSSFPNSTTAATLPATVDLRSTDMYDENGYLSTAACIYVFTAITIATVIFTLSRSFMFFSVCMRASRNLHDKMFTSITRATMYFFNTNTAGRILNRFSKDMGAIDELLPAAMIDCLQIGLALIGIIVVVAIVNVWLLIPTFLIAIVFYLLRIVYLSTSRSVKRLEGITRSPVFAHLNASLQGLTTIRAFNAQGILEKEFDNHQNLHSTAWYIFIASSRAFGFWLDLVCLVYITVVTLSFLVMGNETYGGNVGLAITQSIGLTGMFQWGMRQSAELENQMTSVERVIEYTDVEQEPPLESTPENKPPPDWPKAGQVRFVHVFMRYSKTDPPVLNNLNFTIRPSEKVGIVGRTGAGKSSLISALFRLANLEGRIEIDGVDSSSIGLHTLRSKLSIIPQEPVLFSGTMRKNLDPFDEYSDADLWSALQEVELREAVSELTAGLDSKMSEGGTNFSVGQRQLVCLARAIVRNNKILVLDEATANVDPQTDGLIQSTIRRKFANCTVLTIAHRLHTVMDSDKVLVMDAGTMVEFDHPFILLKNKEGFLSKMVEQTGKSMSEVLQKVAAASYEKTKKRKND